MAKPAGRQSEQRTRWTRHSRQQCCLPAVEEIIDEITPEQFDRTLKTKLYAMFWITKAALVVMKPGSTIVNTASVNSFNPGEELLDYATTKGGIPIFTKGVAKQLAKKGIRVNAVAPGPVWTPLQVAGGQLPGKLGEFGQDTPLGRGGSPRSLDLFTSRWRRMISASPMAASSAPTAESASSKPGYSRPASTPVVGDR